MKKEVNMSNQPVVQQIEFLFDLFKSSEKEEVIEFSKNIINLYNSLLSTDKEKAALSTIAAIIRINEKNNNSSIPKEEKNQITKFSENKEVKKKSFLAAANLNPINNNTLIKKVTDADKVTGVLNKDIKNKDIEVNGSSYKKEEDSNIIIASWIGSEKKFTIVGYTQLSSDTSYTVPHLNAYSLKNSDKTKVLDGKITDKNLKPITSTKPVMKIISFDEVIETNEFFLIPFNNYPKGHHKKHKFLNAYDSEFNFSETEIYLKNHTSITPGFISSIERHPKCELWKIGIKYIYAKANGEINTKFINCLISNKIKEVYQVKVGDLLITSNIVCHNDKTGSDKNAYCTSIIIALGRDAAMIMYALKGFKSELKKDNKYDSFLNDKSNRFNLDKWILPFVDCIFKEIQKEDIKEINIINKDKNEGYITINYDDKKLKFNLKEIFNFGMNDFNNEKKKSNFLKDINNIRDLKFKISSIDNKSYFLNYY